MSRKKSGIGDIVALAVKMEKDGIKFYRSAGSKAKSPAGRLMFQSLARDEESHLSLLNDLLRQLFHENLDKVLAGTPRSRMKSVFLDQRDLLETRLKAGPDDLEALEMAMRMEEEGCRLYLKAGEGATDAARKALFMRLAEEEREHHQLLRNSHTFLSDTGNWFIYEEHATMDGG